MVYAMTVCSSQGDSTSKPMDSQFLFLVLLNLCSESVGS